MEYFSITIEVPDMVNNYQEIFESAMHDLIKAAARKFLLKMAVILNSHVRTGFLRGALTPLENVLGAVQSQGPGRMPQVRRNRRPTTKAVESREYYHPSAWSAERIQKTTRSAIPFATKESDIFETGTIIKGSINKILFKYKIDITYLRINDNFPGSRGRPWNAYAQAIEAFNDEFKAQFPKMVPALNKFIMKRRINLTGSTITQQETVWKS